MVIHGASKAIWRQLTIATNSPTTPIVRQMQDGSFRMGVCGQRFAAARVSFYAAWIGHTISEH